MGNGDAVVDLIPEGKEHYLKCPGRTGQRGGRGGAARRESAFIGRVGADPAGRFMADTLASEGSTSAI